MESFVELFSKIKILADEFGVSKTQISNILHAKDELKKQWMANRHAERMRTTLKTDALEVDSAVFE
jgi:hypothetical protein